jgi:Ni/Co efflux regulator RcnB
MSFKASPVSPRGRAFGFASALAAASMTLAFVGTASPAEARVVRHGVVAGPRGVHAGTTVAGPRGVYHRSTTVVDRGHPGWWHGRPGFAGYAGPRPGYFYAPGHGYYLPPRGYARTTWMVGGTLPPPMRRYVVIAPAAYGLYAPAAGYGWYYAGSNFVLVAQRSGVIVHSVAGGW